MAIGFKKAVVGGLAVAGLMWAGSASAAVQWLPGNGKSCKAVCEGAGKAPVTTGQFVPQNTTFMVCRADAGDGQRVGYNMDPNWNKTCTVSYGGKEVPLSTYDCACE